MSNLLYMYGQVARIVRINAAPETPRALLLALLESVEDYNPSDYVSETWSNFATFLNTAGNVYSDEDSTDAEINAAIEDLETAIALLEFIPWSITSATATNGGTLLTFVTSRPVSGEIESLLANELVTMAGKTFSGTLSRLNTTTFTVNATVAFTDEDEGDNVTVAAFSEFPGGSRALDIQPA